jgi:hypothetical protein
VRYAYDRLMAANAFNVDSFLAQPLTARVATNGPTVRPAWFLWEDGAFWILTGPWARLTILPGRERGGSGSAPPP